MSTATSANGKAVAKAEKAGESVASTVKSASPALTIGAAAAGLAGGLALGSRLNARWRPRRRILGLPLGRKSGMRFALETLGKAAKEASSTREDIHQVREELEKANRQSPVEVLLDGLTHRRGAHRRES